jgi:hypothetical protein
MNVRKGPVEATGLLNWGGATAVAAVAVVRFRPTRVRGKSRVTREAIHLQDIDLNLVEERALREEAAVDSGTRGEQPMAMTTQLPRGTANEPAATAAPPTGLPAEQLYTWLEWVQDDLRRLEARLEYLESARSQLREQERLLSELLRASGSLNRS